MTFHDRYLSWLEKRRLAALEARVSALECDLLADRLDRLRAALDEIGLTLPDADHGNQSPTPGGTR